MSITSTSTVRQGNTTTVSVTTGLSGLVYFHWYVDGEYVGSSASTGGRSSRSFIVGPGFQSVVDVLDTNDRDFDPYANAPDSYPARRTLQWVRSTSSDVRHYRVEQLVDLGDWESIGVVQDDPARWSYTFVVSGLTDLSFYSWRVIPVGENGNDGDMLILNEEYIVRTPDAPDFTATFSAGTSKVTFAEAT